VFAAGDVRYGSVKRVTTAMGEGATVIQLVNQYLAARHDPTPVDATSDLDRMSLVSPDPS